MKNIVLWITTFMSVLSCTHKEEAHEDHGAHKPKIYYTCSMDPQVMETKPGKCPICHMELTPVSAEQLQADGLKLSEDQIRLANIQTVKIAFGKIENQMLATGIVKENQDNTQLVNARIDGRIEQLKVKTKGATVRKGEVLYLIYSEMLAATQTELIYNWKLLSQHPNDATLTTLYEAARNKLLLWGLTELQVDQLKLIDKPRIPYPILSPISGSITAIRVSEGSTVMEGDPLFELTSYSTLWVEALLDANAMVKVKAGDQTTVYVEGLTSTVLGTVVQVLPQVAASSTSNVARILIHTKEGNIRPGMQANVAWSSKGSKALIVPSNAVIREAKGNTVWIKNKAGIFEPKMVHLGQIAGSNAEILHGLNEGDEVVTNGAYLLQSEYVFRKGANPMDGHDMNKM